jgi:hypothetical protein
MHNVADKRLLERSVRKGETRLDDVADLLESLPDLSDNLRHPSDEELEALRQELVAESTSRAERIQRQMVEDRTPRTQAPTPVTPFDAEL